MTTVETELAAARMLPKALALATEPARTNGPVALPIFHEDPARLRRERTTHRLFYSSNFLTKQDENARRGLFDLQIYSRLLTAVALNLVLNALSFVK
jgi:hypothetical protein